MDIDDIASVRKDDPIHLLLREDLDRLSVEELATRLALLKREVVRTREKMEKATAFRKNADSLFKS